MAEKHQDVIMPGYTHLQRAQPVLFAHHMMAYFSMFGRDFDHLPLIYKHADVMPLGAGALRVQRIQSTKATHRNSWRLARFTKQYGCGE